MAARNEVLAVEVERDRAELERLRAEAEAALADANLQRLLATRRPRRTSSRRAAPGAGRPRPRTIESLVAEAQAAGPSARRSSRASPRPTPPPAPSAAAACRSWR